MVRELRDKEKLRQTFGLHVGRGAAERILASDLGWSGVEDEATVMGNTVNVASRIQALTKTVGRPLLVTDAVRDRSADSFAFDELPPQEVRGIEGRVMIFTVIL